METNPYQPTATEPFSRNTGSSLLHPANPNAAAAIWFVVVAIVHFATVNWIGLYLRYSSIEYTPVLILILSIGLYFRVSVLRQVVVFVGSVIVGLSIVTLPLVILGLVSADTISYGRVTIDDPARWMQVVLLLSFIVTFCYPLYVLRNVLNKKANHRLNWRSRSLFLKWFGQTRDPS